MILGGAECVWRDVLRLEHEVLGGRAWPGLVIAVNDAGADWPGRLDHWVTFHPEKFTQVCAPGDCGDWIRQRERNGYPAGYATWSCRSKQLVDRICKSWDGGSSGLLGLAVARKLGCFRNVLCGIPMDARPHYHAGHGGEAWPWADKHWRIWLRHESKIRRWARSMSGRSREHFGAPTLEWLRTDRAA